MINCDTHNRKELLQTKQNKRYLQKERLNNVLNLSRH